MDGTGRRRRRRGRRRHRIGFRDHAPSRKLDQSNGSHCDSSDHCDVAGLSLRKDAQNDATASTILFVAGGAVLAAGLVIYVTAPRTPSASALVVAPAPLTGGGGAIVRTSF